MNKPAVKKIALIALLLGGVAFGAYSGVAKAAETALSDAQKTEIKGVIKEYLLENPEIIAEAMNALRDKQEREMEEMAKAKLVEYKEFFKSDTLPVAGNKDGDVVLVEFFDYNCGYCKKAWPDVQKVIEQDKNVKVVLIDMPILGPSSLLASQFALAAMKQGKYLEYHQALMEYQGQKDPANLQKIAEKVGIDGAQLAKDAQSQEVKDMIEKNMQVAQDLGIRGTPGFIIGERFIRGYIEAESILATIKAERG